MWGIVLLIIVELGVYHEFGHIRNCRQFKAVSLYKGHMLLVFASAHGHLTVLVGPR